MSRSASRATQFTATSPHAYSKPPGFRSTAPHVPTSSSPLPNASGSNRPTNVPAETPAEKVARLRAAHVAKKAQNISIWDRIVVRGRSVADTAHRLTVYGIIGFSGG